jgi:RNA polymerase sigma factor (sigma-70 family)
MVMDDTHLAEHLARDLDGAFEALVLTHVDRCHAIALRLVADPRDAEEVTQDALVRAYRALTGYPPDRIRELRLRPWLTTIVLNLARNRVARRKPAPGAIDALVDAGREPAAGEATDPEHVRATGAERDHLAGLLAALPERYRVPVVLRHVDDLTYAELAEVLGRPEGTLKAQVHRGLAMLRTALAAEPEELSA